MKRNFKLIVFCLLLSLVKNTVKAQYVDIPNTYFRDVLIAKYPSCFNASMQLDTTCAAILDEDSLVFHGYPYLFDMNGIQYFKNLRYLDCSLNGLRTLQYLPESLDTLLCGGQRSDDNYPDFPWMYPQPTLSGWNSLPAGLLYLNCAENCISSVSNLPAGLKTLICSHQFQNLHSPSEYPLPVLGGILSLPATLEYLDCSDNCLTILPALPSTLKYLYCSGNRFHYEINYGGGLIEVHDYAGINTLPALPASLIYLDAGHNALTTLPALPNSLITLSAGENNLTSLPDLPAALTFFGIGSNSNLAALPSLPSSLNILNCSFCYALHCLPHLPSSLQTLNIAASGIGCMPNTVSGLTVDYPKPLCNLFNNTYGCVASPIISGTVFYDNNSNGIQDPGEGPRANVRAQLNNGLYVFSNINGHFELNGEFGSNTLTVIPSPYYNAVPASFNYTFNADDTVVNASIALQPAVAFDSLQVYIIGWGASPGFETMYEVYYENVGTTVLNPNIVLTYNNSILTYGNSSNASVTQSGNQLHLNPGSLAPGQSGYFDSYFVASPTATLGASLDAFVTITGGTSTVADSTHDIVTGAYDPNDKNATVSLTRPEVNVGKFINYVIRFQNTGTDTATRVVILDKLPSRLILSSVQMIGASHPANISLSNDTLMFEFRNINLPDSNVNEPASHGYVRFRAQSKTNLPDNAHVINNANIYFDFNSPILTNNATTLVNLVAVPVTLSNFNAKKQNNSVQLSWTTAQEINSKSFIIERSADQRSWSIITNVNAAGNSSSARNYSATDFHPAKGMNYYRLKTADLDNKFSYSEIRPVYFGDDVMVLLVPNPVNDKLTVYCAINENITLSIYNENGQLVKQVDSKDETITVDVSDLPPGVYYVKLKGENLNTIKKFIVRH